MELIDRVDAIKAMDELEQEDIEAYGCPIPEGFDGERARVAICLLPTIPAIPIEVLQEIKQQMIDCSFTDEIEDEERWYSKETADFIRLDTALEIIDTKIKEYTE